MLLMLLLLLDVAVTAAAVVVVGAENVATHGLRHHLMDHV